MSDLYFYLIFQLQFHWVVSICLWYPYWV